MVLRATAAPRRRMSSRELIGRSSAQHASSCGRWQQLGTDGELAELASGASAKVNRRFGGAVSGEREDGSKLAVREKREVGRRQNMDKIFLVRFRTNLLPTTDSSAAQGVRQVVNLLLSR